MYGTVSGAAELTAWLGFTETVGRTGGMCFWQSRANVREIREGETPLSVKDATCWFAFTQPTNVKWERTSCTTEMRGERVALFTRSVVWRLTYYIFSWLLFCAPRPRM